MPPALDVLDSPCHTESCRLPVFSALVDLLTFFLLMEDLSIATGGAQQKPVRHHNQNRPLGGRRKDVRRKLHLSLESRVPRRP